MTEPQLPPALARLETCLRYTDDGLFDGLEDIRAGDVIDALSEARALVADRDRLAGELEEARAELADTRVMSRIWSEDGGRESRFLAVVKRLWRQRTWALADARDHEDWSAMYRDQGTHLIEEQQQIRSLLGVGPDADVVEAVQTAVSLFREYAERDVKWSREIGDLRIELRELREAAAAAIPCLEESLAQDVFGVLDIERTSDAIGRLRAALHAQGDEAGGEEEVHDDAPQA